MMEKLYYLDRYMKEFTAEILEVKEIDGAYHVVLDKSAFFPGGGGQPGDTGFIENNEVKYVYEDKGILYHVIKNKPLRIALGGSFPVLLNALFLPLIWYYCYGQLEYLYLFQSLLIFIGQAVAVYGLGSLAYVGLERAIVKNPDFLC